EKEKTQPQSLVGKWELRHVLGVQIADAPSQFEKGNGNIIEFSADEYQRVADGKVYAKGTYEIVQDTTEIDSTKYQSRIIFDASDWKVFIKVSGNKLHIRRGSIDADGTTNTNEWK